MFSEVFWTFLISSVLGCFVGIARMLYKSKCKSVTCCGMHIDRDIEAEEKIDEMAIRRTTTEEKLAL